MVLLMLSFHLNTTMCEIYSNSSDNNLYFARSLFDFMLDMFLPYNLDLYGNKYCF